MCFGNNSSNNISFFMFLVLAAIVYFLIKLVGETIFMALLIIGFLGCFYSTKK